MWRQELRSAMSLSRLRSEQKLIVLTHPREVDAMLRSLETT